MKKSLEIFMLFLLGIGLFGCSNQSIAPATAPAEKPVQTQASSVRSQRPVHFSLLGLSAGKADYGYRSFLQNPVGMAWGPDNLLYVADWMGRHVVRVAADGALSELETWRDPNIWQNDGPRGIAFSPDGILYVNDHQNIYKLDKDGKATKLVDVSAGLVGSITFSPSGELYYTDRAQGKVLRWNSTGQSEIIAEDIPAAENLAFGLDGTLYVSQMSLNRVVKVNVTTGESTEFAQGVFGNDPIYMAIDRNGDIWFRGLSSLVYFSPDGTQKNFVVDGEIYPGGHYSWHTSAGITFDNEGGLWTGSYNSRLIHLVPIVSDQATPSFKFESVYAGFEASSVALGLNGEVYATNLNTNELWQFNTDGTINAINLDSQSFRTFDSKTVNPSFLQLSVGGRAAVAVDGTGEVYIGLPRGEIVRLEDNWSFSHVANIVTTRMIFGSDGALYAVANNHADQSKTIVRITGVDELTTLAASIADIPLGSGEVQISPAPNGLFVFSENTRDLFFIDFNGQGQLVKNLASLGGSLGNPVAITSSPNGDIYYIPHGPYELSKIDPSGKITKFGFGFFGDPWDMVVSTDGKYLYVIEVGAVDRIVIGK